MDRTVEPAHRCSLIGWCERRHGVHTKDACIGPALSLPSSWQDPDNRVDEQVFDREYDPSEMLPNEEWIARLFEVRAAPASTQCGR